MIKTILYGILCLTIGIMIGVNLRPSQKTIMETPSPKMVLPTGAVMLERAKSQEVEKPKGYPDGATILRRAKIILEPDNRGKNHQEKDSQASVMDHVKLNVDLVQVEDGTKRIIVKSDNAKLIDGIDIPVSEPLKQIYQPNQDIVAIVGHDVITKKIVYGVEYSKYFIGGKTILRAGFIGTTVFIGAGIRF